MAYVYIYAKFIAANFFCLLVLYISCSDVLYTMKVSRQKSFAVFMIFSMSAKLFYFKMALFKYGFKRKYVGFHESFFTKVCVYNLPRNFSTSKLSWYTVYLAVLNGFIVVVIIMYVSQYILMLHNYVCVATVSLL